MFTELYNFIWCLISILWTQQSSQQNTLQIQHVFFQVGSVDAKAEATACASRRSSATTFPTQVRMVPLLACCVRLAEGHTLRTTQIRNGLVFLMTQQ